MDLFDILLNIGLVTTALVAYLIFFRRSTPSVLKGHYRQPAWNYPLRLISARFAVKRWKASRPKSGLEEGPRVSQLVGWDCVAVRATAPCGAAVMLAIRKLCGRQPLAEVTVYVKLADGVTYSLPQHPDTAVGHWVDVPDGWSAGGLKIQVLEPKTRLRIVYNGPLTRADNGATHHVRFNFIWASASTAVRFPEDWSASLAAQALALEPWRDHQWPHTLGKWGNGSWMQWGAVQGRFIAYDRKGGIDKTVYLEARGTRERSWSPKGYQGLRRTVTIMAMAKDGTGVQLCGFSYKDVLTLGFHGSVRFPDYTVKSITDTNLVMSEFCEDPEGVPKAYAINVSTKGRDLKVVLRMNADGGRVLSGVPYQHETHHRTFTAIINGEVGTGILELGYEAAAQGGPSVRLAPTPALRWLSEGEAGRAEYCLPFEARAAACPALVGGKGASLALLASVQQEQGYRVPPGFCVSTRALERHLAAHPALVSAIEEIEAAAENYDEDHFKEKCAKTVELFAATEIVGEVRDEILVHLAELRMKATEENMGTELRFAVRSSGVGEDSESLSAAGQNETVLGCASDESVLRGVRACWASMYAFTSAHYRRQNGQPCLCGGGVVVQALVRARAAGVLFTRHPARGDPNRIIITANYGLGESVVSGSVDPDTIVVSRGEELTVSSISLGAKKQRVIAAEEGVGTEEVPEAERRTPCITVAEALRLAAMGVAQDRLWGAGRDIEWAVAEDDIYLLQARPITALERWTEEELLHEVDFPIMSDDELITFANTGEVLPRPTTALSYDLVYTPLEEGINEVMFFTNGDGYDKTAIMTHNRLALALYNTIYRRVPKKLDIAIRMLEMAVHGHKVADERILATALHRREPRRMDQLLIMLITIKTLWSTKSVMKDTIKIVNNMGLNVETNDPLALLDGISSSTRDTMLRSSYNHSITSSGSTSSQLIAMLVLMEGADDFTVEQCNEINTLLSSGDVLSAEVPKALAQLARQLQASGRADEFRALKPSAAMNWLCLNLPKLHNDVLEFLEKHGHRAFMEFELATKPWVLVPEEMMEVLQHMHPHTDENKSTKSNADIIACLKTPKKASTRRFLRWLLPLCHRTVRHRELTKAHLILCVHKLRMMVRRLARLMVRHWYLPDEELVFHFRLHELRDYLVTRDPALLRKATQRRQYYPEWSKLKFAEMNTGWVRPLVGKGPVVTADDVRITATSVCGGVVVARACVVKDLSEIGQLQRGDVLITHSTDIGWSPYFPLLSGIVTELGGLISHGAVIAREYGLPCIVGASDATDTFRTGDMVRLSGDDGSLERVRLQADTPTPTDS